MSCVNYYRHQDTTRRGDKVKSFLNSDFANTHESSRDTPPSALRSLKRSLDNLTTHINSQLFQLHPTTLSSKGLQIAHYPPTGARYVKHRDASPLTPNRRLTLIYYLSENWSPEDGGQLRIYPNDSDASAGESESTYIDISPLQNRLVVFLS